MLDREQFAGAGEAGLDLVGDQEDAVLVADAAELDQKLGRRDVEAAFALDRLDDDRRDPRRLDIGLEQVDSALSESATRRRAAGPGKGTW